MITRQQISITAVVAGFVGVSAAVTTVEKWWPRVGWETPAEHERDMANQQTAIGVLSDQIRCRRWQLELEELYARVNGGDNSRRLSDRIDRHRDVMDRSSCERFDKY